VTQAPSETTGLFYEDRGQGPPIVFLHGLGATHEMWRPQIEHFASSRRVIAPDVRGTGRSAQLLGFADILGRQADDLAALFDSLGVERSTLCGVSYGGVLAQRFVLDNPERVHGLVVVDSFSNPRTPGLPGFALLASSYLFIPLFLLPKGLYISALRGTYACWPLALEHMTRAARTMRGYETLKVRLAINRVDYTPDLGRIECPVLGIVGDHYDSAVEMMRAFTEAVPGARLEVVEDSFDPTNLCQPDVFNALLQGFLDRCEGSSV